MKSHEHTPECPHSASVPKTQERPPDQSGELRARTRALVLPAPTGRVRLVIGPLFLELSLDAVESLEILDSPLYLDEAKARYAEISLRLPSRLFALTESTGYRRHIWTVPRPFTNAVREQDRVEYVDDGLLEAESALWDEIDRTNARYGDPGDSQ